MKTAKERIRRAVQSDRPMTLISLRLPEYVIDDLKEVAAALGSGGYQALIRGYISNELRKHLAEFAKQHERENTVEEFRQRLLARGVSEEAVQQVAAEMQAAGS